MKKITVYQTKNEKDFTNNMLAMFSKRYTSIEEMEPVVMLREQDIPDEDILNSVFEKMNSHEYSYSLNYSLSVGDIVSIDGVSYRCEPTGWSVV